MSTLNAGLRQLLSIAHAQATEARAPSRCEAVNEKQLDLEQAASSFPCLRCDQSRWVLGWVEGKLERQLMACESMMSLPRTDGFGLQELPQGSFCEGADVGPGAGFGGFELGSRRSGGVDHDKQLAGEPFQAREKSR